MILFLRAHLKQRMATEKRVRGGQTRSGPYGTRASLCNDPCRGRHSSWTVRRAIVTVLCYLRVALKLSCFVMSTEEQTLDFFLVENRSSLLLLITTTVQNVMGRLLLLFGQPINGEEGGVGARGSTFGSPRFCDYPNP